MIAYAETRHGKRRIYGNLITLEEVKENLKWSGILLTHKEVGQKSGNSEVDIEAF